MLKPIELRVSDLEDLIADIPQLISRRLESLTAALQETNGRLGLLDRQVSMLVRDVRDMRGGVTIQLLAQDREVAGLRHDVEAMRTDVTATKADVTATKADVTAMKGEIQRGFAEILSRLPRS